MDEGVGVGGDAGSAQRSLLEVVLGDSWIDDGVGVGGCAASAHSSDWDLFILDAVGVKGGEEAERVNVGVVVVVGVKLGAAGDSIGVVVVIAAGGGRCFLFFRRLRFSCRISCRRRITRRRFILLLLLVSASPVLASVAGSVSLSCAVGVNVGASGERHLLLKRFSLLK